MMYVPCAGTSPSAQAAHWRACRDAVLSLDSSSRDLIKRQQDEGVLSCYALRRESPTPGSGRSSELPL